jgi:tetrathionate reductase subunit C
VENVTYLFDVDHEIYWGVLISAYFFYTGISAGTFILASLGPVLNFKKFNSLAKTASIISLITIILAPIHLIADLAQPSKFWYLLIHFDPTSAMSYGVVLLLLSIIIDALYTWNLFREDLAQSKTGLAKFLAFGKTTLSEEAIELDKRRIKRLGAVGFLLAIALEGYTGFLLANAQVRALWHTSLMPFIFLISALVSGTALLIIIYSLVEKWKNKKIDLEASVVIAFAGNLLKWFIAVDGAMLVTLFITLWYGNSESYAAGYSLLRGDESFSFIFVELIVGLLIPFILLFIPKVKEQPLWISFSSLLSIIGVISMRVNFVIGGQKIPLTGEKILSYQMESFDLVLVIIIAVIAFAAMFFLFASLPMNRLFPAIQNTTSIRSKEAEAK